MAKKRGAAAAEVNDETDDAPEAAERSADDIIRAAKIDPDNIIGELAEHLLAQRKAASEFPIWEKMTQADQQTAIDAAHDQAKRYVAGVVDAIVLKGGLQSIPGTIEGVGGFKVGEGLMPLKVNVAFSPRVTQILSGGQTKCTLTFAESDQFDGPMTSKAAPDQKALELASDAANDADGAGVEGEAYDPETGELDPKAGDLGEPAEAEEGG